MVMTRLPAFHVWRFLMKNMIPTNSGLMVNYKYNTRLYKVPFNLIMFLYKSICHSVKEMKENFLISRGWHSDISYTPIFILGKSADLSNICFES